MDGDGNQPTYPLARVISLANAGRIYPSERAIIDALGLGFDTEDMKECVLGLCARDFHGTKESYDKPGQMLDEYLLVFRGKFVYVKVRITQLAWTKIVSFHRGE